MSHFSRKCYSTVKQQLQSEAGYSPMILSEMDTIFMATYAAGNIINGKLGDTFNPTTILAIGLFGSGLCLLLINMCILLDLEGYSATLGNVFILTVYFLFGFFQATGGPVGTAVMGNWFCDPESVRKRGTIFGFWTCHQVRKRWRDKHIENHHENSALTNPIYISHCVMTVLRRHYCTALYGLGSRCWLQVLVGIAHSGHCQYCLGFFDCATHRRSRHRRYHYTRNSNPPRKDGCQA